MGKQQTLGTILHDSTEVIVQHVSDAMANETGELHSHASSTFAGNAISNVLLLLKL